MTSDQQTNCQFSANEEFLSANFSNLNFWDINSYKTCLKRIEDGAKLCDDFMKMIKERIDIEAAYYNKLKC